MIKVIFFASIREQVGTDSLNLSAADVATAQDVVAHLVAQGAAFEDALSSPNLLIAVNQEMTGLDAAVKDGDEIAFFPPVTGG